MFLLKRAAEDYNESVEDKKIQEDPADVPNDSEIKDKEIEKVEVEKELNWFQKTFLYLGYLTGLVIFVYLLIRLVKVYLKIK